MRPTSARERAALEAVLLSYLPRLGDAAAGTWCLELLNRWPPAACAQTIRACALKIRADDVDLAVLLQYGRLLDRERTARQLPETTAGRKDPEQARRDAVRLAVCRSIAEGTLQADDFADEVRRREDLPS